MHQGKQQKVYSFHHAGQPDGTEQQQNRDCDDDLMSGRLRGKSPRRDRPPGLVGCVLEDGFSRALVGKAEYEDEDPDVVNVVASGGSSDKDECEPRQDTQEGEGDYGEDEDLKLAFGVDVHGRNYV
ncbi:uncharacterized protein BCR38DRAFT_411750 [Pseudomassariella vexata]|uniref:Uncharacterized protein n=1 Tax=Pseudomassariella vexata TaxID=1141098 RepID=A0A1Y2DMY1_9PEZI|nr:uncharacterized protein BCR38DRAFT_411750 [Pseudomassariella vexata]ORY60611.1 hypothetical protein BCR38DRAFT_411750 [Pseudomassariella vexata]